VVTILSAGKDESLLETRKLVLQSAGYAVITAFGVDESIRLCREGTHFDLAILCHTIPHAGKRRLISTLRQACSVPVICLQGSQADQPVPEADYHVETDPKQLLDCIARVLAGRAA
jgi:DNA-binding response OmpR family regulator